ncbi:hypothetical protein CS542_06810 [Pedobacter sp. IW39]|nr:hypothetical protein CS542_06810 [Pedobacter sp. IW39]
MTTVVSESLIMDTMAQNYLPRQTGTDHFRQWLWLDPSNEKFFEPLKGNFSEIQILCRNNRNRKISTKTWSDDVLRRRSSWLSVREELYQYRRN